VTCILKGGPAKCVAVDAMLGWLARWLRILGVDAPPVGESDEELLSTPCLLVTRDRELFRRRKGPALLLLTDDHAAWLSAVINALGITPFRESRCPKCNALLYRVDCEEAERAVGHRVASAVCWRCPNCGSYYWLGSHWRGILSTVQRALERGDRCEVE
jgi:uncharacterized protein with PIN domain